VTSPKATRVAIVGAGIAGLTAAHHLKQAGFDPFVLEAADHVGGRIQSVQRGDATFDIGAFIYLGSYTEAFDLMQEVGLGDHVGRFKAYGAMPRHGKLHYLDFDTPVRTILRSGYLSAGSKLKMLKLFALLFKHWKDLNYEDADGIAAIDHDTVTSYCERELNAEILEFVAAVVVRGPWLTSPQVASVGQLLWTLKNFFKPYFYGLQGGMDVLPRALAAAQDVRLGRRVLNVTDRGARVDVTWADATGEHTETVDRCLITTTTDQALAMFPQMQGVQREFYESTQYITSVNTHLLLSRRPANPATYIMAAPSESPDMCGVIVDHLKAAGRVPDGQGMLTVFCRHEWCVKHLEASDQQVLDQVLSFVKPYYGDLGATLVDHRIGRWPRVVPLMPKGRFKAIAAYQRAIDPAARVQFAGDLAPIGGVNAALVSGRNAARRIVATAA
jgi:protoporphyrinogen/coproporphyrinogen III oxidase